MRRAGQRGGERQSPDGATWPHGASGACSQELHPWIFSAIVLINPHFKSRIEFSCTFDTCNQNRPGNALLMEQMSFILGVLEDISLNVLLLLWEMRS